MAGRRCIRHDKRQNRSDFRGNQNTKQDLQQSEAKSCCSGPSSVVEQKKLCMHCRSLLAIIGVLGEWFPYVAAGSIVIVVFNGVKNGRLHWGLIAGLDYLVKIVFLPSFNYRFSWATFTRQLQTCAPSGKEANNYPHGI